MSSRKSFGSKTHRCDPVVYDLNREADGAAIEGEQFRVFPMVRCAFVVEGQPQNSAQIQGKKASYKEKRSLTYVIPWRMADKLENRMLMSRSVVTRQERLSLRHCV